MSVSWFVARLLSLAHRIDGMIRSGELRDWADAARLLGVTRARMTQIANLLLLAPDIQSSLLSFTRSLEADIPVTEHSLRDIVTFSDWQKQRAKWERLSLAHTGRRPEPRYHAK